MSSPTVTVLLVEDNPDDVLLIQRAFRSGKIMNPLKVVGDGEEAIAYLFGRGPYADRAEHPLPGLVLLDLKLPKKSGHEVLEWLRQQPILRRLRVVVLTSSKEPADINRAYDLGANSYLVKPVSFDSLIEMVRALDLYWMLMSEQPEVSNA